MAKKSKPFYPIRINDDESGSMVKIYMPEAITRIKNGLPVYYSEIYADLTENYLGIIWRIVTGLNIYKPSEQDSHE